MNHLNLFAQSKPSISFIKKLRYFYLVKVKRRFFMPNWIFQHIITTEDNQSMVLKIFERENAQPIDGYKLLEINLDDVISLKETKDHLGPFFDALYEKQLKDSVGGNVSTIEDLLRVAVLTGRSRRVIAYIKCSRFSDLNRINNQLLNIIVANCAAVKNGKVMNLIKNQDVWRAS